MKRTQNEDNLLLLPEESLFCVADGMGGHSSGEIASRIAVEEMADFFRLTSKDREATWPYKMDRARNYDENRLTCGIRLANQRIFERSKTDQQLDGMGTTIVSCYFVNGVAYVAHVGDSRVYFEREGVLRQITEDHSLLNQYLKEKKLSTDEIDTFQFKNVILRALGMRDTVQVDISRLEPKDGDLFLLCSDGLSSMVPDAQIQQLLASVTELDQACTQLIDMANAAGGSDNITCILARWNMA
jgi:PPM family protein phosphatase